MWKDCRENKTYGLFLQVDTVPFKCKEQNAFGDTAKGNKKFGPPAVIKKRLHPRQGQVWVT